MAKLLKLRRGTTSQHSSFTGAEGEVTVDTDKETLVVHDGSTAGGHPVAAEDMANVSSASIAGRFADDAINPSKIAGGTLGTDVKVADGNINGNLTIENADVTNTAAIAGTKISPDFGSQAITTTGNVSGANGAFTGSLTVDQSAIIKGANDTASILQLHSDRGDDNADQWRFIAEATGSELNVQNYNSGNWQNNLRATGSAGVDLYHSNGIKASTTSSGLSVTGDIAVSGTVDGVDVAARNTLFGGLTSSSGVLSNGVTATTQSASDNSTKVATTAYTDTAIANLVDSSPGALNTLNELAAAINDDANFSTTVTNSIATKMPLAGGEFTGDVISHNITPDGDSSRNLGTNSVRFANVYADNFVGSGSNLTGIESFVTGMIILWSGAANAIPSGFVLCDGNNNTPNLAGRFVVGYSASNSDYDVNDTGGSETVTLTTAQLPAHSHTTNNHTHSFDAGNHTHSFSGSGSSSHSHNVGGTLGNGNFKFSSFNGSFNNAHTSTGTSSATVNISVSGNTGNGAVSGNTGNSNPSTNNTGSGNSHENRPPYYALCYIMKT